MSHKEREQLHAEFSILNSLQHQNIVGYYHREHHKTTQELYLYMEYCDGGDLGKEIRRLKAKDQYADEEYVWSIFSQLIAALYRCHYGVDAPEAGKIVGTGGETRPTKLKSKEAFMILHRDLKPENGKLGQIVQRLYAYMHSLPRSRQLGKTWRFWFVKAPAIP